MDEDGVVEIVRGGDGAFVPGTCVGVEAVGEAVFAEVGGGVGGGGGAEQGEANDVIADVVAVFAVVEEADAVVAFAEVGPFLGAGFEACPVPTAVAVGGALDVAPLDFVGGLRGEDVYGKGDFKHDVALGPVNPGVEVEAGGVVGEGDALNVLAVEDAAFDFEGLAEGAVLKPFDGGGGVGEISFVVVEDINVPGVPVFGAVFEGLKLIGDRVGGEDFAVGGFVVEANQISIRVEFGEEEIVFEDERIWRLGNWVIG